MILALIAAASTFAWAVPSAQDPSDEIVLTGTRQLCRLTSSQLRAALRAYGDGKSIYAPAGLLYFEIRPDANRALLAGSKVHLRNLDRRKQLVPDIDGRFALPRVGAGWELVAPCNRGDIAVSPLVMSPDTTQGDRRLGDLRLQCEVSWAIVRESVAAAPGAFVEAAGGCKSSATAIHAVANRRIASAAVVAGSRIQSIMLSDDRRSYRLPLHDRTLPNAARVRFSFD